VLTRRRGTHIAAEIASDIKNDTIYSRTVLCKGINSMVSLVLVENEFVLAEDVPSRLRAAGFDIIGTAATGKDALAQARELHPDVVLMDPVLKGKMDGIEAAQQITERFDIPVIFLTTGADAATVRRATETASYGFLVMPFDDLELRAAIEMAIYKHRMEVTARESDRRMRELTESLSEVLFETDLAGNITFINRAGLKEFGYTKEQVEGGMTLYDFLPPEKHEEIRETIAQAVIDEPSEWIEVPALRRDGSTFPASVRASVIVREGVPAGIRGIALNVTEQKRLEGALTRERDQAQLYLDTAEVIMMALNREGRITLLNRKGCEVLDVTPEQAVGVDWFEVFLPEDARTETRGIFESLIDEEDTHVYAENIVLTSRGEARLVAWYNSRLKDDTGNVIGTLSSGTDVTERVRAEQKLEESERRIREITDTLPVVAYEADATGRMTFVNATFFDLFGYTKEELEAEMSLFQLIAPADRRRARAVFRRRMRGEEVGRVEYTGLRKDGSTFNLAARSALIKQAGAVVGQRGVMLDVTEQKRAEEWIKESERHIHELTDALPVVVYETDATGRITFVNATTFEMFGYTKEELEAGMSIFHVVTDADKERARAVFRRRTSLDGVGRMEYTGLRKDGSTFPVAAHGAPIRRDGAVVGVRGIVVDITEQKRAEERVKEHTDTIEILNHIMTEGNRAASVGSFAETVTKLTLELIHFDAGTIHLVDADARCANLRYATGIPDTAVEAIREIPLDEAPYAGFLVEPKPLFVDGREVSRVPHAAELGLESLATVPLYRYDALIGALNVGSFQRHTFSQAEKELLTAIGNEVGVVIAKLQADELIKAALKERETLLKEIHHRVKNNMQVVSSLLSLQADRATNVEAQAVLTASQSQIRSMALIHEKLYSSGTLSEIDFADYVESLIDELLRMYNVAPGAITITTDIEDVHFGVDTAMPCALILNELVSNCLKYAFPDERTGEVTIGFQYADGSYAMTVADDGVGFPADVNFRATGSLGMQLVTALVGQLNGTIEMNREDGTSFVISFSLPP
jgi:PAS domain S-box-containing protein